MRARSFVRNIRNSTGKTSLRLRPRVREIGPMCRDNNYKIHNSNNIRENSENNNDIDMTMTITITIDVHVNESVPRHVALTYILKKHIGSDEETKTPSPANHRAGWTYTCMSCSVSAC